MNQHYYINRKNVYVTLDCEWVGNKFISMQLSLHIDGKLMKKVLFLEKSFLTEENKKFYKHLGESDKTEIRILSQEDTLNILDNFLYNYFTSYFQEFLKQYKEIKVHLLFFYSPKDLEYAFGFENIKPFITSRLPKQIYKNWLIQNRCIMGKIKFNKDTKYIQINYKIRDLVGSTNSSFANDALSTGIQLANKGKLDNYKTCIDIALNLFILSALL